VPDSPSTNDSAAWSSWRERLPQPTIEERAAARERARAAKAAAALEEEVTALEERLQALQEEISHAGLAHDLERVRTLGDEYAALSAQLEQRLEEWSRWGEA